jgi:DNA mismatch repair ATPase MutS
MKHFRVTNDKKREFDDMRRYVIRRSENGADGCIDEMTWRDLVMDEVFKKIDYTSSTAGEYVFYDMLRRPVFDNKILDDRQEKIKKFENDEIIKQKVVKVLRKAGKTDMDVANILYSDMEYEKKFHWICKGLYLALIVMMILMAVIKSSVFMFAFGILLMANMALHYNLKMKMVGRVEAVQYLGRLVNCSEELARVFDSIDSNMAKELRSIKKECKKLGKRSRNVSLVEGLDVLGDYLTIIFLIKERSFFDSVREVEKNKEHLQRLFRIFGEVDTFVAVSEYRESIEKYCKPVFREESKYLKLRGIAHPLIDNPISNDISVSGHSVLITGSNMSGKSTFVRMVGVNALLAQTIMTCICDSYEASFFKIVTSISPQDDLMGGKSYYMSEAESIKRIVDTSGDKITTLALIDEIFRGTNPIERVNAAAEILDYVDARNGLVMVATHDLELTKMVKNYDFYYFMDDVDDEGLAFDYTIRPGISPTRNAVKVLKLLGYPDELLDRIEKQLETKTLAV